MASDRSVPTSPRGSAGAVAAIVVALHLAAGALLVAPLLAFPGGSSSPALAGGTALAAYLLGVRHAFDADHIAAIDNATRRLLAEGREATGVGTWFSLGHSTVVAGAVFLVTIGVGSLGDSLADPGSQLHVLAADGGTVLSAGFLYLLAALNLPVLLRRRRSTPDAGAEGRAQGPTARLLGRLPLRVHSSRRMFLIGLLFGLGFDTAAGIVLLIGAADSTGPGLARYWALDLPILFAAGMTLFDSLNGAMVRSSYSWALADPSRRAAYDLTLTGLSIGFGVLIGTLELVGRFHSDLGIGSLGRLEAQDPAVLGLAAVVLFVAFYALAGLAGASRSSAGRQAISRQPPST
jgi:nickel/cobalt transporter (NiCoT) family protein